MAKNKDVKKAAKNCSNPKVSSCETPSSQPKNNG